MTGREAPTRCAFVVCKLRVCGRSYYLLTYDPDWRDLNLLGGHEEKEDHGDLAKTAERELAEELIVTDQSTKLEIMPVTEAIQYGPVWSPSAERVKDYVFKFYTMRFCVEPDISRLSRDAPLLRLVCEDDLLADTTKEKISNVLRVLDRSLVGGIRSVPYSWSSDLNCKAHAAFSIESNELSE
jgi:hypothetical protein